MRSGRSDEESPQVLSLMSVVVPLVFTLSMPLSRAASELYISLVPMTWLFADFKLK
jgi:hypothetical protein